MIWSYPRGEAITKDGETAIDVAAYAAQIAALIGAHIIKIKLSTDHLMLPEAKKVYEEKAIDVSSQAKRVEHCMQASFGGRRIVVFSGGAAKGTDAVYDDARAIRDGGGNGSIIGRNSFQRSREDALAMLGKLVDIYSGQGRLTERTRPRNQGATRSALRGAGRGAGGPFSHFLDAQLDRVADQDPGAGQGLDGASRWLRAWSLGHDQDRTLAGCAGRAGASGRSRCRHRPGPSRRLAKAPGLSCSPDRM